MNKQANAALWAAIPPVAGVGLGGLINRVQSRRYKKVKDQLSKYMLLGGLAGLGLSPGAYYAGMGWNSLFGSGDKDA